MKIENWSLSFINSLIATKVSRFVIFRLFTFFNDFSTATHTRTKKWSRVHFSSSNPLNRFYDIVRGFLYDVTPQNKGILNL